MPTPNVFQVDMVRRGDVWFVEATMTGPGGFTHEVECGTREAAELYCAQIQREAHALGGVDIPHDTKFQ